MRTYLLKDEQRMKANMATRTPKGTGTKPGENCTEFQLHKSQSQLTAHKNVFDYSYFRLIQYIQQVTDEQQKQTLKDICVQYKAGMVAIAWKSGRPVWLKVTKDKA